nr:MAG TPA: hypothetical protein [Caudoviricetes sp.]
MKVILYFNSIFPADCLHIFILITIPLALP